MVSKLLIEFVVNSAVTYITLQFKKLYAKICALCRYDIDKVSAGI